MDCLSRILYINLDRRSDRREELEQELSDLYLLDKAERIRGIPWEPGIVGCGYSHLAALKLAKERDYEHTLILEDDFQFLVSRPALDAALQSFWETETPYDVLFLSFNVLKSEPCPTAPMVDRVLDAQTASGYIVHRDYLQTLIDLYEWAIPELERTGKHWIYANDQVWKTLQPAGRWYSFKERLGKQREGWSDNSKAFIDMKW